MCRITAIKGSLTKNEEVTSVVDKLQANGGTIKQEIFIENDLQIFLNRFDITTSQFRSGAFPLESKKYVFAFNGEIYSFRQKSYVTSNSLSDAHFAFDFIEELGHKTFFQEADFEGTFMVYEKLSKNLFVYVDQLNTKGCFYSITNHNIFITQELSILHELLNYAKVSEAVVNTVKRGHCLELNYNDACKVYEYKPDFRFIWQSKNLVGDNRPQQLYEAFKKAVADRIPRDMDFGVLCGGGVDSSLLLKVVIDVLGITNINRLKIFTLGTKENPLTGEDNDWENAEYLIRVLKLETICPLEVVYPVDDWTSDVLMDQVLNTKAHLITPNPVQTQVRHTVMMSTVLAQIAIRFPEIRVVLTGDFADEIFGGYFSMHSGTIEALTSSIQDKLDDLHLNDAARVTLASLRGCKYVVNMIFDGRGKYAPFPKQNSSLHPIEVRTPFASPLIAKILKEFSPMDLIGKHGNKLFSKYILRQTAEYAKVPEKIAWRKKIPFNEGGTGIRNTEPSRIEENSAKEFFDDEAGKENSIDISYLDKLGISKKENSFEFALYCAAMQNGLDELLKGDSFRHRMPDSNYASSGSLDSVYHMLS